MRTTARALIISAATLSALLTACGGSTATSPTTAGSAAVSVLPSPSSAATTTAPTPTAAAVVTPAPTRAPSAPSPAAVVTTQPPRATAPPAPTPMQTGTVVVREANTSMGAALVDNSSSMTLYTFNSDTAGNGQSMCNGACASEWPPLLIPKGTTPKGGPGVTGHLATITRSDGTIQVTDNGKPLYHFSGDSAPGNTNGSYPGWTIARP